MRPTDGKNLFCAQLNLFYTATMPDSSSSNWADMAASLLGKLSGGVELSCAFEQMELQVPNPQNPNAPAATWKLNGS